MFLRRLFALGKADFVQLDRHLVLHQICKNDFYQPMLITTRDDIPEDRVRKDFGMIVGCHTTTANYWQNSWDRVRQLI